MTRHIFLCEKKNKLNCDKYYGRTEMAKYSELLLVRNIVCSLPLVNIQLVIIGPTYLYTSHGLRTGDFCIDWYRLSTKITDNWTTTFLLANEFELYSFLSIKNQTNVNIFKSVFYSFFLFVNLFIYLHNYIAGTLMLNSTS